MKPARRILGLFLCFMILCVLPLPTVSAQQSSQTSALPEIVANGAETLDGWTADGELTLDTEDFTQGDGCVSVTLDVAQDSNAILSVRATFDDVDVSGVGAFSFDFYISDPALLTASQIIALDFGSSKSPDSELITWYEDAFSGIQESGWYRISLPVNEAINRSFKDTNLNYFCLQFFHVNPTEDLEDVEIKIDNITATIVEYHKLRTVDMCDTADGWSGIGDAGYAAPPLCDTANKKQGTASIQYQVVLPEQRHLVSQKTYEPMNATGATHVEMDVYVSDLSAFEHCRYAIQFEITSSGTCDHQEYCWSLDKYVLHEGWNHIRLPIAAASTCDGAPNMAAINYLRFHTLDITQAKGNVWTFRVDNIYFSAPRSIENLILGATPIAREEKPDDTPDDNPDNPPENPPEDIPDDGEQQLPLPPTPGPGTENENNQNNESALRARQTQQKAKILLILMVFTIIGIDAVVVALKQKKKQDEVLVAEGDGQPPAES